MPLQYKLNKTRNAVIEAARNNAIHLRIELL